VDDELAANRSASPSSPAPQSRRSRWRRIGWGLLAAGVLLAVLVISAAIWIRSQLVASLPQLDGERALTGLVAPVQVERDNLGVPTIRGANRLDVARALGFVHAQDRFFQMDLLRRSAAGELSELFGRTTLAADRNIRVHRFRSVAKRVQQSASAEDRALVEAYASGVNAGLSSLRSKPFEYLLLRTDPAPWLAEDTILVLLAMFIQLNDSSGRRESSIGVMHDVLPPKLVEFLLPRGTEWDAPLMGSAFPQPSVPGPEVFDLRSAHVPALPPFRWAEIESEELEAVGSNNWAVAAGRASSGRALVANDMHLGLAVPNTWYRATLTWRSSDGSEAWISGVTLPGTPVVSVGTNRRVAWAFTNTHGDWNDLVVIEPDARDTNAYLTPDGPRLFQRDLERIRIKGAPDETLEVISTIWGPVIDKDHRGRSRSLRWTAHDPEALNSALRMLEGARTVEDALAVANGAGIPPQNFVCADATGRIAWTLTGRIPRRVGFDGQVPTSWADGSRRWDGWLRPEEYPRIIDPSSGRLWTANARVVDGQMLERVGDGGYANGARARQIRDDLLSLEKGSVQDMAKIQLDDRALFLSRWRDVLLKALSADAVANHRRRKELKAYVRNWGGRASIDSVGYRAVQMFHAALERQVFGALTARCLVADPRFDYFRASSQREGPLWKLVTERPMHLLSAQFKSWDEQILAAADSVLEALGGEPLAHRTWGERNRSRIQHPLSRAVPALGRLLDMPSEPLPGDQDMPRVQAPDQGASERLVVSPGDEASGLFHMPGGQSGHPLSPYYRAGHSAWAHGEPTPFLPGQTVHRLTLVAAPAQ
jgi:penicillin G amidase